MEALTAIQTRNSVSRLSGKVSPHDLEKMISSGIRAPDHGMLRPWRIIVIQGESLKKLGKLFSDAKLNKDPETPQMTLDKLRSNRDSPIDSTLASIWVFVSGHLGRMNLPGVR